MSTQHQSTVSNTAARTIVVERSYRAKLEELWSLWTTKEGFESWWGPQGFRVDVHALDAREGGTLRYDMIPATREMIESMTKGGYGTFHAVNARFSILRPMERLAITSVIDFLPGVAAYEATINVRFLATGDTVRMLVELDPMHSEEVSRMQLEGFTSQLTKLDQRFAKG